MSYLGSNGTGPGNCVPSICPLPLGATSSPALLHTPGSLPFCLPVDLASGRCWPKIEGWDEKTHKALLSLSVSQWHLQLQLGLLGGCGLPPESPFLHGPKWGWASHYDYESLNVTSDLPTTQSNPYNQLPALNSLCLKDPEWFLVSRSEPDWHNPYGKKKMIKSYLKTQSRHIFLDKNFQFKNVNSPEMYLLVKCHFIRFPTVLGVLVWPCWVELCWRFYGRISTRARWDSPATVHTLTTPHGMGQKARKRPQDKQEDKTKLHLFQGKRKHHLINGLARPAAI